MQVRTSIVILANAAISSADAAHAYKNLNEGGLCCHVCCMIIEALCAFVSANPSGPGERDVAE